MIAFAPRLTLAAAAALTLAAGVADAREVRMQQQIAMPQNVQVSTTQLLGTPLPCVGQTPVEFPTMRITNSTGQTIAAGRQVRLSTSNGLQDVMTVSSAVAPGANFAGFSAEAPYTCTALLLP